MGLESVVEFLAIRQGLSKRERFLFFDKTVSFYEQFLGNKDPRVEYSAGSRQRREKLEREVNRKLKSREYNKMLKHASADVKDTANFMKRRLLDMQQFQSYEGTLNGRPVFVNFLPETNLRWKDSGKGLSCIVATDDVDALGMRPYSAAYFENSEISFSLSYRMPNAQGLFCYCIIIPPKTANPIERAMTLEASPSSAASVPSYQEWYLVNAAFLGDSSGRLRAVRIAAKDMTSVSALSTSSFDAFFSEVSKVATRNMADNEVQRQMKWGMGRVVDFAMMFAAAHQQLYLRR